MGIADFFKNALANDDTLPPAQDPGLTTAKEPVEVRFLPANKTVKAYLGQNIGMIAKSARVEIRYKCREGDCGTCTIKFDGKKVKACVSSLPVVSREKVFTVEVPAYGKALDL
jgi:aerobic-type carbon monoxide dehydrogenase small subunit (CoxS/CutS family)